MEFARQRDRGEHQSWKQLSFGQTAQVSYPHRLWRLHEKEARAIELELPKGLAETGLRDLQRQGKLQRVFRAEEMRDFARSKDSPDARRALASLSLVLDFAEASGAFLIPAGSAFNDIISCDLGLGDDFFSRSPRRLEFFLLKQDAEKIQDTLIQHAIYPSHTLSATPRSISFTRSPEQNFDEQSFELNFLSKDFLPSILFRVIEEKSNGFHFHVNGESFTCPGPFLCYSRFFFDVRGKKLPILDPRISNFILNACESEIDQTDRINAIRLMTSLPNGSIQN